MTADLAAVERKIRRAHPEIDDDRGRATRKPRANS